MPAGGAVDGDDDDHAAKETAEAATPAVKPTRRALAQARAAASPTSSGSAKRRLYRWMERYPGLSWKAKAIDKAVNPDVSLKLALDMEDGEDDSNSSSVATVKFHLVSLADVIAYENSNKHKRSRNEPI